MDCSTLGLPVHHQLPEFTQTHVHRVSDAIQPSHPLLSPSPLPSIFPSIRVFSNKSALCIRWPKYWIFSFTISPSNEYSALISFRIDRLDLFAVQGTVFTSTTVQKHKFFHLLRSGLHNTQLQGASLTQNTMCTVSGMEPHSAETRMLADSVAWIQATL